MPLPAALIACLFKNGRILSQNETIASSGGQLNKIAFGDIAGLAGSGRGNTGLVEVPKE